MIDTLAKKQSKKNTAKKLFFNGTRIPINTLIEYLEAGEKIDNFLKKFPSVSEKQTIDVIKKHKQKLMQRLF